jgi:heme/copper-type cytochrome/quinol oxidase subunit 4
MLLAIVLMALSFAIVMFPDSVETLGTVSAVVAVAVIVVLLVMFVRMRKV